MNHTFSFTNGKALRKTLSIIVSIVILYLSFFHVRNVKGIYIFFPRDCYILVELILHELNACDTSKRSVVKVKPKLMER